MGALDSMISGAKDWVSGSAISIAYWTIALLIIFGFFVCLIIFIRNKYIFKYPVRIFRIRENGKVIESNYVGGYIGRKNSAPFFRIKAGFFPWQVIDLTTTPNPKYLDEQNRVYYKQIDVDTYIQMKRTFVEDKGVTYTPVASDVKYGAILSIQRIKDVLRTEPTWKKILPYAGLILVFTLAIVLYVLALNMKCPVA